MRYFTKNYIHEKKTAGFKKNWMEAGSQRTPPRKPPGANIFFTPKLSWAQIWGSKKSWPPRKTSRNRRLCVLSAYQK